MTLTTFHNDEEKVKFVDAILAGTRLNYDKRKQDQGITKNKYRNGNSDEVNQVVYEQFREDYHVDVYAENGYEHIRLYARDTRQLYVLIREGTYREQVEARETLYPQTIHYLNAYAYMNRHQRRAPFEVIGQLAFFDIEHNDIRSSKEALIQQKVKEVLGELDVDRVYIITYEVMGNHVISVQVRIPGSDLKGRPIFEEDWSYLIVPHIDSEEHRSMVQP
ncbi:DUF5986 family protein [Paenibacillus pinihumi]|uniref:DUF5986 family protein n=1 Tax=Paenibacillus pinihumi TaxID=669462 RepID=UPI00055E5F03|nr:DUF5986 family protein [Paenibacillus pinihumi]